MTEILEIYKCEICENIVEVLHTGKGKLVCCGQPMRLLEPKIEEKGKEKHLPVVERIDGKIRIRVGEVQHPMEEQHYIEWIEAVAGSNLYRKQLMLGENPEAEFEVDAERITVRAYCNIHGLWRSIL